MKKRILFVDDDEMVLQGLERYLRPMRDEWEMEFLTSGVKALERLAQAPFDAVVSDMRMPGMNGAELLNEVMKRYPKTIRLILSGYADRELILKCVGSTHQYLAKPCDGRALKMTILRATQLGDSLENATIRQIITRCEVLPSVPALYSEIIEALQNPETDTETIGTIVVRDAAMTAKILKLVNSAFFGLGREIASPAEAVTYLGTDTIKALVLFSGTFSEEQILKVNGLTVESLLMHSVRVACAAKKMASVEGAERKLMDEAYVAGLLHDVGKLVLAANLPEEYQRVLDTAHKEKLPLAAAERNILRVDHADVGGYLLGLWGLPVPVVEAIALHHRPSFAIQQVFAPLTALHVANALVGAEYPTARGLPTTNLDLNYLSKLCLNGRIDFWRENWRTESSETEMI